MEIWIFQKKLCGKSSLWGGEKRESKGVFSSAEGKARKADNLG